MLSHDSTTKRSCTETLRLPSHARVRGEGRALRCFPLFVAGRWTDRKEIADRLIGGDPTPTLVTQIYRRNRVKKPPNFPRPK